jgi:hypothetical protein
MFEVDAAKRKSQIVKLEPCDLVINPNFPKSHAKNDISKEKGPSK